MSYLHVLTVALMLAATWLGLSTMDAHTEWQMALRNNENLESEIQTLQTKKAELKAMPPSPLHSTPEELSVFVSRMLEAGEVLGAALRVESRSSLSGQTALTFETPPGNEVGLQVCRARINATLEGDDALPILSMLEEEMADMPVTVTSVTGRRNGSEMTLNVDVDVYGRIP